MQLAKIIIGTRGSQLALAQTNIIKKKLLALYPQVNIEIKIIITKGDKNMSPVPLDIVGKGWFTKELDKELLLGNIDLAVHSLKDIPETLPQGLIIAGIPEREDPRDVLITKGNIPLETLKKGAIIGTDSARRKTQILHKRPDVIIKSLRGNINRRLKQLDTDTYDAIILASAGLKRLGLSSRITQFFDETDIIPSPGQGALAIVIKQENTQVIHLIEQINHEPTLITTQAERAFSAAIGGGCKTPTGAFAFYAGEKLILHGMIGSEDGKYIAKESLQGLPEKNKELGATLAKKLLSNSSQWEY